MVFGHGVQTLGELSYLALGNNVALMLLHVAKRVDFMHDLLERVIAVDQALSVNRNRLILKTLPLVLTFEDELWRLIHFEFTLLRCLRAF